MSGGEFDEADAFWAKVDCAALEADAVRSTATLAPAAPLPDQSGPRGDPPCVHVEVSLALVANAAAPIVRLQLAQPHGRLLRLVCCKARLLDRVQFVDEHDERLAHATAEFRLLSTVQQAIRRVSDVKFAAAGRTMPLVEHACVHRFVPELTAAAIRMAISPVAESAISSSASAAAAASSAGAHQRSCWKFPLLSAGGAHVARRIDRLRRVSPKLHGALRRHQQEGAVWALQRHGRVLLADEMGVGKTIQALAIAACYSDEWPLLIVAPAAMRLVWAGQVERCFPCLSPSEILVVASSSHRLRRSDSHIKVVITSFRMAGILFEDGDPEFAQRDWGVVVVDEAHQHMRTPAPRSKGSSCVQCLARIVAHAKRALLLSGTPSQKAPRDVWLQVDCLRSGLLGGKRSFEEHYCLHSGHTAAPGQRRAAPANGMRFGQELHALLRTVVMLRRLKKDAGVALPRKFRRVVMLRLPSKGLVRGGPSIDSLSESHLAGLAKVDIACDWIAAKLRRIVAELGDAGSSAVGSRRCPKIIVFAHHVAVMDKICTRMDELLSSLRSFDGRDTGGGSGSDDGSGSNGSSDGTVALHLAALPSVIRFDGVLNDHERQERLAVFQASRRLAICAVSITAGGTGIDLSQASHAFFVELPQRISDALQAESRLHRPGQATDVRAYYLVGGGECDASKHDAKQWDLLRRQMRSAGHIHDGGARSASELDAAVLRDCSLSPEPQNGSCAGSVSDSVPSAADEAVGIESPPHDAALLANLFPVERRTELDAATNDHNIRFLVNRETGRVHLYRYENDDRTLSKLGNFATADLDCNDGSHTPLSDLPICLMPDSDIAQGLRALVVAAVEQWGTLPPRVQHALSAEPVPLPLPESRGAGGLPPALQAIFAAARQRSAPVEDGRRGTSSAVHSKRKKPAELDDAYYDSPGCSVLDGRGGCSSFEDSASSSESASSTDDDCETAGSPTRLAAPEEGAMPLRQRECTLRETLHQRRFELSHRLKWEQHGDVRMQEVKIASRRREPAAASTDRQAETTECLAQTPGSSCSAPPSSEAEDEIARERSVLVQPMTSSGALCAWCGREFDIRRALVCSAQETTVRHPVLYLKRLDDMFCGTECTKHAFVHTNQSKHIRRIVVARDNGRCELCRLDCRALVRALSKLPPGEARRQHVLRVTLPHPCGAAAAAAECGAMTAHDAATAVRELGWGGLENAACLEKLCAGHGLEKRVREGDAWEVDHVSAVHQGGGQCGDDNLRLLCRPCHKRITAAQATERSRKVQQKRKRAAAAGAPGVTEPCENRVGVNMRNVVHGPTVAQQRGTKQQKAAVFGTSKLWTCDECANATNTVSRIVCGMCAAKRPEFFD